MIQDENESQDADVAYIGSYVGLEMIIIFFKYLCFFLLITNLISKANANVVERRYRF